MDTNTYELITKQHSDLITNYADYDTKGNKAALARARKSATLLAKTLRQFRKETLELTKLPAIKKIKSNETITNQ